MIVTIEEKVIESTSSEVIAPTEKRNVVCKVKRSGWSLDFENYRNRYGSYNRLKISEIWVQNGSPLDLADALEEIANEIREANKEKAK
jgi:hypothetical protein